MSVYQRATIVDDAENKRIYVPDQPPGTVLIAFNQDTLGALLYWLVSPTQPYDPENEDPPQVEYLTREEALPIFVELTGRQPEGEEMP